jgi:uncharacterized membrane protein YkgB
MAFKNILDNLDNYSSYILQYSIALIYLWFGTLKIIDMSPAEELISHTLFFMPTSTALLIIGTFEIIIGLLLLHQKTLRYGLGLLLIHLPGILSPVVLASEVIFNQAPYAPALEGHYVLKNLVLLGAALKLVAEELERNPELNEYWKNLMP